MTELSSGSRRKAGWQARPRFTIHTALIAFERVFRRTGPICKTCVIDNLTEGVLQLAVRYGFKEHSWIQLHSATDGVIDPDDPNRLHLQPGRTSVQVLMNTDSSNFPYDRFRGRLYFQEPDEDQSEQWIETSFEIIEELRDFAGYAAIDLGTSNSMISLYHVRHDAVTGMPWSPVLEGDGVEVPSAVFLRDLAQFRKLQEGSCAVGRAAIAEYASNPNSDPRSLQLGVKRLIGADRVLAADSKGAGGYVDPLSILFNLGRYIRERTQGHEGVRARLGKLLVTFPATWDYKQIDQWKEVFRRLGFADEDLDLSLDEASAAGLFSIYQWTKDPDTRKRLLQDLLHSWKEVQERGEKGDQYVLNLTSFDFGGGTIDIALLEVQLTLLADIIRMRVALKGSDSLPYGGDQVTLAVFRILKRRLAMALVDPRRLAGGETESGEQDRSESTAGEVSLGAGLFLLPGKSTRRRRRVHGSYVHGAQLIRECWAELEERISTDQLAPELEDAVDTVFPTRFWQSADEPIRPTAKRNFGWLWAQAETLKRDIFHEASRQTKAHAAGSVLSGDAVDDIQGGIYLRDIPQDFIDRPLSGPDYAEARAWVKIGEVNRAIAAPLEHAVWRARQLAGDRQIDRIVLTGQSSWIPMVRRLFMRPGSEGGFGLAPNKIEFDEENAKAAVSKGACLLRVMRNTLVGFSVDVSDFKANLLSDLFYKSPVGGNRTLFHSGPIDDLHYVEESPDPASFAELLSVFQGSPDNLLGQFEFHTAGEPLADLDSLESETAATLGLDGGLPNRAELQSRRKLDPEGYVAIADALRDWPERALIAWMERTAESGTEDRPVYRYYVTRNRSLIAVRDRGEGGKRLFRLRVLDRPGAHVSRRDNPYSGAH